MHTDSFILSFDTNQENLIEFLKQTKNKSDLSELDKSHELYDPTNKKVRIETSPILMLDSFVALRSKSYSFSYSSIPNGTQSTQSASGDSGIVEKAKQKGIQHTPKYADYINSLFNSQTSSSTNISIRSKLHNLTVEKQNKRALNAFDDKRLHINGIQSFPWDKQTQQGDCPRINGLKLVVLYYKELSDGLSDEETHLNVWYWKKNPDPSTAFKTDK